MHLFRRTGFVLVLALTALSNFASAAGNSIHGTITDPLGAAISGAQVQLLREGKPMAAAITDSEGKYRFGSLAPGPYQVKAEAPGFAAQQTDAVSLGAARNASLSIALKLASGSQEMVVSATGIQVPDTQVGASVSVITADQFQHKLPSLEPLRQVPGVQVLESGQRGIPESIFIRGG